MRNLIVCCDGTWNDENNTDEGKAAPTNVRRLFQSLVDDGVEQLTRYQAGVGTGGLIDKALGGLVGSGITEDIKDCYYWLCDKYRPGDQIHLFGFSRGAFSARSLGGLITKYGIVQFHSGATEHDKSQLIDDIYDRGYRRSLSSVELQRVIPVEFHGDSDRAVHFVGVWDTVGALGIPDDKAVLDAFDNPTKYQFHDVTLSSKIRYGRHALAIDEMRSSFTPTLWKKKDTEKQSDFDARVKQIWFPGVHSDIGGGYKDARLALCTLKWMLEEIQALPTEPDAKALIFEDGFIDKVNSTADPLGELHDSHTGLMKALLPRPRAIPNLSDSTKVHVASIKAISEEVLHPSFPYRRHSKFKDGVSEIDVYAKHPWNWTGIYLEKGKSYKFTAKGMWNSGSVVAGPKGSRDGKFQLAEIKHVFGSFADGLETLAKRITGNEDLDIAFSRRHGGSPWLMLMGCVANERVTRIDGTPEQHHIFEIGSDEIVEVTESGYLYCFANDAWGSYKENRNYVSVRIEEV